jgi:hypothetical protein
MNNISNAIIHCTRHNQSSYKSISYLFHIVIFCMTVLAEIGGIVVLPEKNGLAAAMHPL